MDRGNGVVVLYKSDYSKKLDKIVPDKTVLKKQSIILIPLTRNIAIKPHEMYRKTKLFIMAKFVLKTKKTTQ